MEPVKCLDGLYRKLKNENGFSKWKQWMQHEEYDFECVVDDVNGPIEQSDIKEYIDDNDNVPDALYRKIQAYIKGELYQDSITTVIGSGYEMKENEHNMAYNTSHTEKKPDYDQDMIQLIRALKTQISNKDALELILQKIIVEKYDFENIHAHKSLIGSYLMDHNINDSSFAQFCDIVKSFQEEEKEITADTINASILTQPQTSNNDAWHQVLCELRRNSTFPDIIYQQVIQEYSEQKYELDDVAEENYDDTEIIRELLQASYNEQQHHKLHSLLVEGVRRVYMATTQTNNPIPTDSQPMFEPEMNLQSLECVDEENGEHFKHMKRIKTQIERLHIEESGEKDAQEHNDNSLIMLLCVFGINSVQEMIDLWVVQTAIAYNHDKYIHQRNHLMQLQSQFKDCFGEFVRKTFQYKPYHEHKFKDYFEGFNVVQVQRFLGYGKFSNIITELSKKRNSIMRNSDRRENESEDEDASMMVYKPSRHKTNVKYKASYDNYIYWSAQQIQMYCLAFIITLSNQFSLHCESVDNCAAILDISVPNIINGCREESAKALQYNEFKNKMDTYMNQFSTVFHKKRDTFEYNMKESHVACWSMDLSKGNENKYFCNHSEPDYIGRTEKDIGNEIEDKEYRRCYEKVHLFWMMRVKRIFTQKVMSDKHNRDKVTRIGIAVHKFDKQCIKLYLHYQGAVVRIQFEDIAKWFRELFKYRTNEINESNWCLVEQYLEKMSGYNQIRAQDSWTVQQTQQNHKITNWDKKKLRLKSWNDLDSQFVDKNLNLCQHIVNNITGIEQYLNVYAPYLNQLNALQKL